MDAVAPSLQRSVHQDQRAACVERDPWQQVKCCASCHWSGPAYPDQYEQESSQASLPAPVHMAFACREE